MAHTRILGLFKAPLLLLSLLVEVFRPSLLLATLLPLRLSSLSCMLLLLLLTPRLQFRTCAFASSGTMEVGRP